MTKHLSVVLKAGSVSSLPFLSSCSPLLCAWQPSTLVWCPTLSVGGSVWSAARASLVMNPHWQTTSRPLSETSLFPPVVVLHGGLAVGKWCSCDPLTLLFSSLSLVELCQTAFSPSEPAVSLSVFLMRHKRLLQHCCKSACNRHHL